VKKAKGRAPKRSDRRRRPSVIILTSGAATRLRSSTAAVLHRVGGRTLLETVLEAAEGLSPAKIIVVLGPARREIQEMLAGRAVTLVVQDPPAGTGDAARRALAALPRSAGPVLILSGDVPLLRMETLRALLDRQRRGPLGLVFLSALRSGLARLSKTLSREADLTELVAILTEGREDVAAVEAEDWREAWSIRTRRDLAAAEEIARRRAVERALDAGATIVDPNSTRIGPWVEVEPDVVIHPFVALEGHCVIREGCEVFSFTRVADSVLEPRAAVGPHCDIEGAKIGARSRVGPFARLRPGTVLEEDVRVGNFVETKKTVLKRGVKALHLSYLGDAEIGADTNIGAGTITCNYDGEKKHRTTIGQKAFIGSDSQLVAPVTVGDGAYVGAGSTITQDVPPGALAVTRVPQKNVEGWVARRLEKRRR
jgi:bifunctional UDP-N-acetylglucosamine pyrophosphorylase/glucosamine-1-phosphate N-acetyltransferase